jgi:hypothetical protein
MPIDCIYSSLHRTGSYKYSLFSIQTSYQKVAQVSYIQGYTKNGNFWKTQQKFKRSKHVKLFLWWQHAVDRSTDPRLLNGEVVCSSRSLFCSAATWLPLRISKVPVFVSPCVIKIYVFLVVRIIHVMTVSEKVLTSNSNVYNVGFIYV